MIYNDGPSGIRQILWLTALLLFTGYQIVNVFVPNADMIVATRILAAAFYSVVVYAYAGDAWAAVRRPVPTKADFLIVGIWLSFLSHLAQTVYAAIYRLADAPQWLLNAEIVPVIVLLSMMAAVLHVAATGSIDGEVPRRSRIALGICVGAAVLMVGAIVATRPDIGPAIERTRPYIGDWWRTGEIPYAGPAPT
ncbi:hypothetical protein MEX01_47790 [Methylorubrum extorquens]|uniref:hypothetical protein n=1 Tax=Methylorubrum extorquens TaxID=408 RepID=UPI001167CC33|nr:hypothetical protein [Methylorubrum extorquens]GEL44188.1 hypothetical protein MEX01_47790 [Methylorubrum extorquens]